ncbi:carbohydrate ABC transporter permease [Paenibacillus eucommiae]|uniref:Multiple sugar transport system permease protein n=1 Tax=Paenibacillus eucommiae TaxID=1355755 RepID=A0ABS4ISZ6_9BACL|nr:sugar ABC transporter permease [Paenibacillus eucommiae]MBP1990680.1 multiple sugar transport system permease protein [Paenibacillus eucommiae]
MLKKEFALLYKERYGYLFVAPALLFFTLFYLYPIVDAVRTSFYSYTYYSSGWAGLDNYQSLLQDDVFLKSVKNTLLIVLMLVPASLIISLLTAIIVSLFKEKMQSLFKAVFYIPAVTSIVSITFMWQYMINYDFGLLNYVLSLFGIGPLNLLSYDLALFTTTGIVLMLGLGAPIVILTAALGGIPASYYEAAELDGASFWRKHVSITLPMLKPSILYVVVTGTIAAFQLFAIILLFTAGGPHYATSTILLLLYQEAFVNGDYGRGSAMAVILSLIIVTIAWLQFKFMKTDIEY